MVAWIFIRLLFAFFIQTMDYSNIRTGLFDDSYVSHVIFFTSISEKTLKNKCWINECPYT